MKNELTSKHIAQESKISVGKIRHWVKLGHFNDMGYVRKRAFYFQNLKDAVRRAREIAQEENSAPQEDEPEPIFDQIDKMGSSEIEALREREELKSLVIKNKKHADQYVLVSEYEDALRTLALQVRVHMEGMPSRFVATVNSPELDKKVYDFCVKELDALHGKIKKLTS